VYPLADTTSIIVVIFVTIIFEANPSVTALHPELALNGILVQFLKSLVVVVLMFPNRRPSSLNSKD
jgi:hypothetical protein